MNKLANGRLGRVMNRAVCGVATWRAVREEFEKAGDQYLSFEAWDRIFEIASNEGLLTTTSQHTPEFVSPFGFALLQQWRRIRDARSRGLTAKELAQETVANVNAERALFQTRAREYDKHRTKVRAEERAERDKFSRKEQRRLRLDNDEAIA